MRDEQTDWGGWREGRGKMKEERKGGREEGGTSLADTLGLYH